MAETIREQIETAIGIKQAMLRDTGILGQIEALANQCLSCLRAGGKIIFAGNGGSFADAQHLSAEFTSRFLFDRAPLPSLALGTNNSAMSAIGNDYGYDKVFARELAGIAKSGDVFVPITTSGNSANILEAVAAAKDMNLAVVALAGHGGGKIRAFCECICIPSSETARIQECHIMVGHILCGLVESEYFQHEGRA